MRKPNKNYATVFIFWENKKTTNIFIMWKIQQKKTLLSFSLIPYTTKTTSEGGTTVNFFENTYHFEPSIKR